MLIGLERESYSLWNEVHDFKQHLQELGDRVRGLDYQYVPQYQRLVEDTTFVLNSLRDGEMDAREAFSTIPQGTTPSSVDVVRV